MLKSHEKFHSVNGKRRILIVDDEIINREILSACLQSDYEVLCAADGAEALEKIRDNRETLSLVLLDLLMPVLSGIEVLKAVRTEPDLARIPIIVLTADQEAEVECLKLGASDFIPKPYPAVDVILARVLRTIELSEDRDIIQSTERDPLTGLYNKEYFYRYAEQYDQFHRETPMDAIVLDINHFHMINERYGKAYGDEVLRRIGQKVREMIADEGGIVCRREADTFMVYCPHREDYREILENASLGITDEDVSDNRIRLRMGVYAFADKTMDVERRFDHAKMAADSVQGSFAKTIGMYDQSLHDRELMEEQLIEDFPTAIREGQFVVYYQPKYDIRGTSPRLTSAEALVRWQHPKLGMISPGIFIPLFEKNGLIQELDHYVWDETCRQIRDWEDRLGEKLPVSVNVSRVDMYDPELISRFQKRIRDNGLSYSDLLLEVTESAYTQDTRQIVEMVTRLRKIGFQIEMDDFGTGYSSLNMISTLPLDALKLDMHFIREAFREEGNTRMVEVILDIADFLSVPVIAEGVETEEQLKRLKTMGCDIVQGYYFSRPVPAEEFDRFILEKIEAERLDRGKTEPDSHEEEEGTAEESEEEKLPENLDALKEPAAAPAEQPEKKGLSLQKTSAWLAVLSVIIVVSMLVTDMLVTRGYQKMGQASNRYIEAQSVAAALQQGSDVLTNRVRSFVVTGDTEYLQDYFEEIHVTKSRSQAVADLASLLGDTHPEAQKHLNRALELSDELVDTEYRAMSIKLEAGDYDRSEIPQELLEVRTEEDISGLSDEEKDRMAQMLVFDDHYMDFKQQITENVGLCTEELILASATELDEASNRLSRLLNFQTFLTILLMAGVIALILFVSTQVRKPLLKMLELMRSQKTVAPTGAEELRFVTRTYNAILQENMEVREQLSHEASHDALTGLLNRGAYDMMMEDVDESHIALIIVDVDYFKQVNDTYGHAVGDRILKRVADLLKQSFRSVDMVCRIGGDEFVVIMTRADSTMRRLVRNKIAKINEQLQMPQDDLPAVSLSVGVAFGDRQNPQEDIFKDADTALYRVKEAGRNGCEIY